MLRYPFMTDHCFLDALTEHVHATVSPRIPSQLRGDVCQDILCAIVAGELLVSDIKSAVPKFLAAERKLFSNPKHLSIEVLDGVAA